MTSHSDRHNKIVAEFVHRLGHECDDFSEAMVVLESMLLGAMLINTKLFGLLPGTASSLVELAVQEAIERFVKEMKK